MKYVHGKRESRPQYTTNGFAGATASTDSASLSARLIAAQPLLLPCFQTRVHQYAPPTTVYVQKSAQPRMYRYRLPALAVVAAPACIPSKMLFVMPVTLDD